MIHQVKRLAQINTVSELVDYVDFCRSLRGSLTGIFKAAVINRAEVVAKDIFQLDAFKDFLRGL